MSIRSFLRGEGEVGAADGKRHLGKNIVIIAALTGLGFFVAWLRFRPYLGNEGRFTDGTQTYDGVHDGDVRYAVWDRPLRLPEGVNGPEGESRPTLSPDGRFLVFSVGERGLGSDLYIAEMVGGVPVDPRSLATLNTAADEMAPCFSGGALWFASDRLGTSGGLDLYRADYDRGVFGDTERIDGGINSTADDTDPAPIPGSAGVVFASNRKSRGLLEDYQLYEARPRTEAEVAQTLDAEATATVDAAREARKLATDDSGSQSELESVLPVDAGKVARERAARSAVLHRTWIISAIEALNTAYHEREPAFTSDGRTLFFASNREGGAGAYDLYRSTYGKIEESECWLEPEALTGVNTAASERGPSPSRDGFSLMMSVGEVGESAATLMPPDLYRARSLELFRSPGPPVGWVEILVLLALALLALLAWLAKRWEQLEVVYKCFLISVFVHFLMMWYFREVYPEGEEYALHDGGDRIRVRLVADNSAASQARNSDRSGELKAERANAEPTEAPAREAEFASQQIESQVSPAQARLERAQRLESAMPERADLGKLQRDESVAAVSRERAAQTDVRHEQESFETRSGAVPSLKLDSTVTEAPGEREAGGNPEREAQRTAALREAAPSQSELERSRLTKAVSAPDAKRIELARSTRSEATRTDSVEIAQAQESFERRSGESQDLSVEAGFTGEALKRGELAPRQVSMATPDALEGRRAQATDSNRPLTRSENRETGQDPLAGRQSVELERETTRSDAVAMAQDLDTPTESFERRRGGQLAENELLAEAPGSHAPEARVVGDLAQSARGELSKPELDLELMPSVTGLSRLDRREAESFAGPTRQQFDLDRKPSAPERAVALDDEAPSLARQTRPATEEPAAWENDLIAAMTPMTSDTRATAREARADVGLEMPERLSVTSALPDRGPEFEPLHARAEAPQVEPQGRIAHWDHTPYQSRTGDRKTHALELHGGTEETEAAVAAGLAYLARRQHRNGYWGSSSDLDEKYGHVTIGKTGLSLLAFLGAGHTQETPKTPTRTEYSHVVERAIEFLLAVQNEVNGHFGYTSSYGHAIATYALAEVYALTEDERLKRPLQRAVSHIQRKQVSSRDSRLDGGWGYYYPDGHTYDRWPRASVTAWQVMALESAQLGGLRVDEDAFASAKSFLMKAWDSGHGAYRYSHDPSRLNGDYPVLPGSTPATLFALSLLGEDIASASYRPARRFVLERSPQEYSFTGNNDFVFKAQGNLYFWYYGTLSLFRVGGSAWEIWNASMKECLLPAQQRDGSWEPISIYSEYAADTDEDRSYSTAMCVLTLEVYYRYFTPLLRVK